MINGRGDTPNRHDVLTGSQPDGRAFAAGEDRTCGNWTKSGAGAAMVGHHDRQGLRDDDAVEVLEFVASLARPGWRLQPGRFEEHRRRRPVLLLRHQLSGAAAGQRQMLPLSPGWRQSTVTRRTGAEFGISKSA